MSEPNTTTTTTQTAPPAAPATTQAEKTFTQTEVDAMIGKRVAAAMKGVPSSEELEQFKAWKESRQTEQEKLTTAIKERDTASAERDAAKAELEQIKRERALIKRGIAEDDLEYYAFKIGKLVTDSKDFEKAADEFFKDHPASKNRVRVDLTAQTGAGGTAPKTENDIMNSLLRGVRK